MDRDDERNCVIQFRKNPPEMAVPSVTMDKIGFDVRGVEIDAATDRAENRLQRFRASETARVQLEASDFELSFFETLIAEAAHFHRHRLGQLARETIHMHAGAAVNVRRIFVS